MLTRDERDLGDLAAKALMQAAVDWWQAHVQGTSLETAAATMVLHLRVRGKTALGEGLADAKEAFDAGLGQVAEATFLATIRLAGIQAAKDTAQELNVAVFA